MLIVDGINIQVNQTVFGLTRVLSAILHS